MNWRCFFFGHRLEFIDRPVDDPKIEYVKFPGGRARSQPWQRCTRPGCTFRR